MTKPRLEVKMEGDWQSFYTQRQGRRGSGRGLEKETINEAGEGSAFCAMKRDYLSLKLFVFGFFWRVGCPLLWRSPAAHVA